MFLFQWIVYICNLIVVGSGGWYVVSPGFDLLNIIKSNAMMLHSCCIEYIARHILSDHTKWTTLQRSFCCAGTDTFLSGMRINNIMCPW